MKWIALVTLGLPLLAALCFSAFVRLAPVDPARWHVTLADQPTSIKPNDATAYLTGGDLAAPTYAAAPDAVLARLEALALSEPRTRLVAGSAGEGRLTLMQRSALWGMPDFITAEATATPDGTRLQLWSRARFGFSDFGTNRQRLTRWIAALHRGQ